MRLRLLFLSLLALPLSLRADLKYTLRPDIASQTVGVTLEMDSHKSSESFHLPAWVPGYYLILNNQNKIGAFKATDEDGKELKIEHEDSRTWTVLNPKRSPLTVHYKVLGDDPGLGFFAVHMDDTSGYVNGPAAFMYLDDRMKERMNLKILLPSGWDVATSMDPVGDGSYSANSYDEFVDHPIQMGKFVRDSSTVMGILFDVVFVGPEGQINCNTKAETRRLMALSAPAIKLFGGASFKRYTYIIHLAVGNFAGGLEHRASNVQAVSNSAALNLDELATHEYFHAWNVKQIRPVVLGPFDYTQPVLTGNLWFAEGVTDYYAYITAYRSGVLDSRWLAFRLGQQINRLQDSSNRESVTLEDCSRRAWESGGAGVGDLSYYNKGLVAGLIFDAVIRSETGGAKSLDDVMRLMYKKYKLPAPGYDVDGIHRALNEVSGRDLTELYHLMIQTTGEMPYDLLAGIGLKYSPGSETALIRDPGASGIAVSRMNEWLHRP